MKRYKTQKSGKQYEYTITADGGRVEDPVYTKREAMQLWRDTIRQVNMGIEQENEERNMGLPGPLGGREPFVPGPDHSKDDDDADPFSFF